MMHWSYWFVVTSLALWAVGCESKPRDVNYMVYLRGAYSCPICPIEFVVDGVKGE